MERTSLMNHIRFFDTNNDDKITVPEMYGRLREMGVGRVASAGFAVLTAAGRGIPTSGKPWVIDVTKIKDAMFDGHAGVFDGEGQASVERADKFFFEVDTNADGVLDPKEISARLLLDAPKRVNRFVVGIGWKLLLKLVKNASGQEGLTREQVQKIYTGKIFEEIVALRKANGK